MKKIALLCLGMIFCAIFLTSCLSLDKDTKLASPEELILINAERTRKLQQEVFGKAIEVLSSFTTQSIHTLNESSSISELSESGDIESYIDQLDVISNNLSEEEKLKLDIELQNLTEYYETQIPPVVEQVFAEYIPSGIYETRDVIYIGDDIVIDKKNPDNALFISDLVRLSKGLPPIIKQSDQISVKGLYRTGPFCDNLLWPEGKVQYRFSTSNELSSNEKAIIKTHMQDWVRASNEELSFEELSPTLWRKFMWTIGLAKHVVIQKKDFPEGIGGEAKVGRVMWSLMSIDPESFEFARTIRHELGHVLGLLHEHQRPDRDNYVKIVWENCVASSHNYEKLDESFSRKILKTGKYDYFSIMHYMNLNYVFTDLNGNYIDTGGWEISQLDAEFIRTLY